MNVRRGNVNSLSKKRLPKAKKNTVTLKSNHGWQTHVMRHKAHKSRKYTNKNTKTNTKDKHTKQNCKIYKNKGRT